MWQIIMRPHPGATDIGRETKRKMSNVSTGSFFFGPNAARMHAHIHTRACARTHTNLFLDKGCHCTGAAASVIALRLKQIRED